MKTLLLTLLLAAALISQTGKKVKTGADILFEQRTDLIDGKRIGLITNHSAVLSNGKHLADALHEYSKTKLVALFGPEHGVRGDAPDGRTIRDTVDEKTGVPVYSLYGKINKPTPEMLNNVDVLIFDVQDVGARFYTYISTMFLGMDAAAENGLHYIVLDRPNPITGVKVEGPIRVDSLKTFVGWVPIPTAHGMTVGELAVMANSSGWLQNGQQAKLSVVKMENWKRSLWFDETSLRWIHPSPNMKTLATATVYPGLCLIEGINVSEGRGTTRPFEQIGAPWMDGKKLAALLNDQKLPGVKFSPVEFTPAEIPNVASNPKYKDRQCFGVSIDVTDRTVFRPVLTGTAVVWGIYQQHSDSLKFRDRGFDRLAGTPVIRQQLQSGKHFREIAEGWNREAEEFQKQRAASLLYGE